MSYKYSYQKKTEHLFAFAQQTINAPPAPAIADLATHDAIPIFMNSSYFLFCMIAARSSSVKPDGSGSCPGMNTGATRGGHGISDGSTQLPSPRRVLN